MMKKSSLECHDRELMVGVNQCVRKVNGLWSFRTERGVGTGGVSVLPIKETPYRNFSFL